MAEERAAETPVEESIDEDLEIAVSAVRRGSRAHLKEEILRQEWADTSTGRDKDILAQLVKDESFWIEVKRLAQEELEQEVTVMGEEQFRQMFKEFDADGSGAIDLEELQHLLEKALKLKLSPDEVLEMMKTVASDGKEEIDEDAFIEIMNEARRQQEDSARNADQQLAKLEEAMQKRGSEKTRELPLPRESPGDAAGDADVSPSGDLNLTSRSLVRRASDLLRTEKDLEKSRSYLTEATAEQYKSMLRKRAEKSREYQKFSD